MKTKTLIFGDFFFGEHVNKKTTIVHSVRSITLEKANEVYELAEKGLDDPNNESYIVLEDFTDKLKSENKWWCYDVSDAIVVFDEELNLICGFQNLDEMRKEYPKAIPVGDLSKKFKLKRKGNTMQDCMFNKPPLKPTIHHFSITVERQIRKNKLQQYKDYVYPVPTNNDYDYLLSDKEADALGFPSEFIGVLHFSFTRPVDESNWKPAICECMGDTGEALEHWTWDGKTFPACCATFGDLIQRMGFKYSQEVGDKQIMWLKLITI